MTSSVTTGAGAPAADICALGIDFGTTNSVISAIDKAATVTTARFVLDNRQMETFRSILCYWLLEDAKGSHVRSTAGPGAVQEYLSDPLHSRIMMSMKSYLSSRLFRETRIFGFRHTLETIIGQFLDHLFQDSFPFTAGFDGPIIAGRPVQFAGDRPDETLAIDRLRQAYGAAGVKAVEFAYEPEGAAYTYARRLDETKILLVADFGGGTSDFSLVRFEPGADGPALTPLAHSGIGIAGDMLDYRIIDNVIAPKLGKGAEYKSFGKSLPVPKHIYSQFARWHMLSHLKGTGVPKELREIARGSTDPEPINKLIRIIEEELGFSLYQTVSGAKAALSSAPHTELVIDSGGLDIKAHIDRADFETWIAEDLAALEQTLDRVLEKAELKDRDVDRVFLTGGTSFVPAIRRLFQNRYGEEKTASGDEFDSVSKGLALIGRDIALGRRSAGSKV